MAAIPSTPADARSTSARAALAFVGAFAAVLLAANVVLVHLRVQHLPLPEYGTWTGVVEIDNKVRLLREFARAGPVDVLILSSSLGDYGISAETLSAELSARYGRPTRVFNFSIGGADLPTYPVMYRLARLVAQPKQVWVVAPVSRIPTANSELGRQIFEGPVGRYEKYPGLAGLTRVVHDVPLVRLAPSVRDALIYGGWRNRPAGNHDVFDINPNGDTVSWLHDVEQYGLSPPRVAQRRREILGFARTDAATRASYEAAYFGAHVITVIRDLRDTLARDGAKLVIVPIDYSTAMPMRDAPFVDADRLYFERLSRELQAPVIDARRDFVPEPYMIQDAIHMNTIGAREFSRALAARIAGAEPAATPRYAAARSIMSLDPDPTWSWLAAHIPHRPEDPSASLELRYMQSWGVQPVRPGTDVRIAVRLPDNRDVTIPARIVAPGEVVADTSGLALPPVNQVLRLKLMKGYADPGKLISVSVASFRWSADKRPAGFYARQERARVRSESPAYALGQAVRAEWHDLAEPKARDWIGLFPVAGDAGQRVDFRYLQGASAGRIELAPIRTPGRYELRLYPDDRWEVLDVSEPFEVR